MCEKLNEALKLVDVESSINGVSASIATANEHQAEAIRILLETAISTAEIAEYNDKQEDLESARQYDPNKETIQWGVEYTEGGNTTFFLSTDGKPLTEENVRFLLDLSLKGKFERVQALVEELFPYGLEPDRDGMMLSFTNRDGVENEIGSEVLNQLIGKLFLSHGIGMDDCIFGYNKYISKDDVMPYFFPQYDAFLKDYFVTLSVPEASYHAFIEGEMLHKEKYKQAAEDKELVVSLSKFIDAEPKDMHYVESGESSVTLTISRGLLKQLQQVKQLEKQASDVEKRLTVVEEIVSKGSKKSESHVSQLNTSGSGSGVDTLTF